MIMLLIVAFLCLLGQSASAAEVADPLAHLPAVPDPELATMRGGFTTSNGMEINIGLEQAVLIDGVYKSMLSLNIAPTDKGHSASKPNLLDQNKLVQIIQSGGNNVVSRDATDAFSSGILTLIQNSLDAKMIQNLTVLNVGVLNLSQFHANALGASINLGLIQSLR